MVQDVLKFNGFDEFQELTAKYVKISTMGVVVFVWFLLTTSNKIQSISWLKVIITTILHVKVKDGMKFALYVWHQRIPVE